MLANVVVCCGWLWLVIFTRIIHRKVAQCGNALARLNNKLAHPNNPATPVLC
jgi:hypothetical protein